MAATNEDVIVASKVVFAHPHAVVDLALSAADREELMALLVSRFDVSIDQAEVIASMPIHRFTEQARARLEEREPYPR